MSGSGATNPLLIRIPDLPAATTPLGADDLLIIEQGGLAKKVTASSVIPGGTIDANLIYAGPASGSPSIPTFRALTADDLPAILNSTTIDADLQVLGNGRIEGTLSVEGALTVNDPVTATDFLIGGNGVLKAVQQGTITAYDFLMLTGAGVTLTSGPGGGTLSIPGAVAGAGITVTAGSTITNAGVIQVGTLTGTIVLGSHLVGASGTLDAVGFALVPSTGFVVSNGTSLSAGVTGPGLLYTGGTLFNYGVLSIDSTVGAISIGDGLQRSTQTISVKQATTSVLGGVIIGTGLAVSSGTVSNDGVLSFGSATGAVGIDAASFVMSGSTLTLKGGNGFMIEMMQNELGTATQFGTFDVGPMPFAGTIDSGSGRAGAAGGTISVTSSIGANSGGTISWTGITGLAAFTLDDSLVIQDQTASAANVFAVGDYLRAVWSQTSGSSTGSLWSLVGRKG